MALTLAQFLENAGSVNHARDFRRMQDKLSGWDVRVPNAGLATTGLSNGGVARYYAVATTGDFSVTQRGAGANMSVDVSAGFAMVGGTESATQGNYGAYNDAVVNVAISASDPTNARIDVIGIRIRDAEYSGANNDAAIIVVTGTPSGAPAVPTLPADFLSLAHVAVAALAASIVNANITDKRRMLASLGGTIPVASFASLPTVNLWAGMKAYDMVLDLDYVRSSVGTWCCVTPQSATVATSETTASATYADLATSGPSVTVQTGTKVLVTISMDCYNNAGTPVRAAPAVSGATTLASADANSVVGGNVTSAEQNVARTFLLTGLTAGSNVFKLRYNTFSGTATCLRRDETIQGIPS